MIEKGLRRAGHDALHPVTGVLHRQWPNAIHDVPHCIHYGTCGGCTTDILTDKSPLLANALTKAGYADPPVAPMQPIPLRTRRRADLGLMRIAGTILLGLRKFHSNDVVDMQECILLDPAILALLPPLRTLLRGLECCRRAGSVAINLLDRGPDILLRLDATPTTRDRGKMIAFAQAHDVQRISTAKDDGPAELVAMLAPPILTLAGIAVQPAPAAFLQASRAGEAAIIAAVLAGLPKLTPKSRVVELYSGIGTITFALAALCRVESYEGSADAVRAQDLAIRSHNLAGRIILTQRDLARRPLRQADLAGRAAVVLDPPYAGAAGQIPALIAAAIPCIIYISCNPAALATDAYSLQKSGYQLVTATPIDQFPYSENLESVVVFSKA